MTLLGELWRGVRATMRSFGRRPTTVQYPAEIRERSPRLRRSLALVHDEHGDEACIGCLQCERICPSQVITVKQGPKRESPATGKKRGWAEDLTIDLSACIFCELCVQVCPADALVMTTDTEAPTYSRGELFLTMAKLYANEKGKARSWSTGTLLMEVQDPKRGEPKVEKPKPDKPKAVAAKPEAAKPEAAQAEPAKAEPAKAEPAPAAPPKAEPAPAVQAKPEGSPP